MIMALRVPFWAFFAIFALTLTGCSHRERLTTAHLVDVNGFAQTVTQSQRLEQLEKVDFLSQQPYQKVLRTWKDNQGQTRSVLTSYFPSGRLMQYLEGRGGKAWGKYQEWYENGQLRIEVNVEAGRLDFGDAAEESWVFDGLSKAYDEQGRLEAEIPYQHGLKEGTAKLYHSNGKLWQQVFYQRDLIEGQLCSWYETGEPLVCAHYSSGKLHGSSTRYWPDGKIAAQEDYNQGKLIQGQYFDQKGILLAQVKDGQGHRMVFGRLGPVEKQTIREGKIEGWIGFYDDAGVLWHQIHVRDGLKDGEEIYFYSPNPTNLSLQPKISMHWQLGVLHGVVRTWYPNGQLQSERHIIQDQPDGAYLAYYPNGSVRIVEQYRAGKLISGDYFELNSTTPISSVRDGQGRAMIYADTGQLEREIVYSEGDPIPEQKPLEALSGITLQKP